MTSTRQAPDKHQTSNAKHETRVGCVKKAECLLRFMAWATPTGWCCAVRKGKKRRKERVMEE